MKSAAPVASPVTKKKPQVDDHGTPKPFASENSVGGFPMPHTWRESPFGPGSKFEMILMGVSHAIRNRPDWWNQLKDPSVASQEWKDSIYDDLPVFSKSFLKEIAEEDENQQKALFRSFCGYAIRECRWMADRFGEGPSRPGPVQGVYCRDDMDATLQSSLLGHMQKLRSKNNNHHRNTTTNEAAAVVEDHHHLVDPSLYCFQKHKTPTLNGIGAEALVAPSLDQWCKERTEIEGKHTNSEGNESTDEDVSESYYYSDDDDDCYSDDENPPFFHSRKGLRWLPSEFRVEANECRIHSYINNLHPTEHADLYAEIGRLFVHCVPLLEDVLNDRVVMDPPARLSAEFEETDEKDGDGQPMPRMKTTPKEKDLAFEPYSSKTDDEAVSLEDRPLQVVVEIGSGYDSNWHVKGCLEERIVATACCCICGDEKNTTTTGGGGDIEFRLAVEAFGIEQNDWGSDCVLEAEFGLRDGHLSVQPRGHCFVLEPGRALAWSNVWQTRMTQTPGSISGATTLIQFHLVDPALRIRSTATVPPQQKEWLCPTPPTQPSELLGISLGEAEERRRRLVQHRSDYQRKGDDPKRPVFHHGYVYNRAFAVRGGMSWA